MIISTPTNSTPPAAPASRSQAKPTPEVASGHSDFFEFCTDIVKNTAPAGAVAGGLGAYFALQGANGLSAAAIVGVPTLYAVGSSVAQLAKGFHPPGQGQATLVASIAAGLSGAAGACIGAHYGSAILGAAIGALTPSAICIGGAAVLKA